MQALRLGATDYLPRQLITPERLLVSIEYCLHSAAGTPGGGAWHRGQRIRDARVFNAT